MHEPLPTYLRDHLGGANFAVELLETWSDAETDEPFAAFAREMRVEIERDRETLRQVIERVGKSPRTLKAAAGWLAEKASRFKLRHQDDPGLARFEALEILSIGILGKKALWEVLRALSASDRRLSAFDFEQLALGAVDQHARTEAQRILAAKSVFIPEPKLDEPPPGRAKGVRR